MQTLRKTKSIQLWILMAFFLSIAGKMYAQPPAGAVLITGTDFTPKNIDVAKTYYDINDATFYGLMKTRMTVSIPFAASTKNNDFFTKLQYGITDNFANLNSNYFKAGSGPFNFVFSHNTTTTNLPIAKFDLSNLKPGSPVYYKIDYCSPSDPTKLDNTYAGDVASFKSYWIKADGNPADNEAPQVKVGVCSTLVNTVTASGAGSFLLDLKTAYQTKFTSSLAISKIEIWGTPNIEPVILEGTSICNGEMITLQTSNVYDADYEWFANDGSGFVSIGKAESMSYQVKNLGTISFYVVLTLRDGSKKTIKSSEIIATSIKCCESGSRQTIFYDDFGTFDMVNDPSGKTYKVWDYSDPQNPQQVIRTTSIPFVHDVDYLIPNHTFRSLEPISEGWSGGEYIVAAYISPSYPGKTDSRYLNWIATIKGIAPNPLHYDVSGKADGAALFLNLNPASDGKVIYKRTIPNLCSGKKIYFETWGNWFSTDAANRPTIQVRVKDVSDPSNVVEQTVQMPLTGPWTKLSSEITLKGTELELEIINKSGTSEKGNDLMLDEIKLTTCSSPKIDLYFGLNPLQTTANVCNTAQTLYSNYSTLFSSFYSGNPYFLFQWSLTPRVMSSWKNLGAPTTKDSYDFSDVMAFPDIKSLGLKEGTKIYFRVVAADKVLMDARNNFQGTGNEANAIDPCEAYSVSRHIIATVKCPACEKADITGLKVTAPADTLLCASGTRTATQISVATATPLQPAIGYQFFKSATSAFKPTDAMGTAATAATGFSSLSVAYADAGWYTLKVWDKDKPTEVNCQATYQIQVATSPAPTYTMTGNQTICDGAALSDIGAEFTAVGDVSFSLNIASAKDGSPASATSKVVSQPGHTYAYTPAEADAPGTFSYTITDLKDKYCPATDYLTSPIVVKVNPNPKVVFADPADICTDATAIDLIPQVTIDGVVATAATGVTFSGAAGVNITPAGLFTPSAVTAVTSQTLTAKYEDATTHCKGEDNAVIKIQPKPELTIALNSKYCSEETIDLMAAVTPKNGTFTVLPAVTISATNTVDASKMISGDNYTFTYNYLDAATGCSNTINGTTYSITVPPVGAVTNFAKSGIKTPTETGSITALVNMTGVPTGKTPVMNWKNPDGTDRAEHTETITVTHDASVTKTFTYKAYQTLDGCVGPEQDVTFSVSPCAADAPLAAEAYFCSASTAKSITVTGQRSSDVVGWLPLSAGADGFKGKGLPHSDISEGATYSINTTAEGTTEYYVAAYDAVNNCWSSATKVTFIVKAEPTASIKSQDKIACYNYNSPKPIEVKPVGVGVTGTFKLDNVITPIPQYVPSAYSNGATLNLSYQVDSLITPAGYTGTAVSCTSKEATQVYTVEFVKAPTIVSEKQPIDTKMYELTMTGDKATNELRWYLDPAAASVKTGAKYDPIQGVDYSLETADKVLTVYGKEVSPNGCESAAATGTLTLVKCPHTAPGVVYEKPADKLSWDDCEATVKLATPAVKIDNASLAKRSTTTNYVWYDDTKKEITRSNAGEYVPANIAVGKHKLYVSIDDIITETGTYCETPATEVNYEVFRMPVPDLTIPKSSLCVYDSKIDIKGLDDSKEVSTGTFYMTPGSTSTIVPMAFDPTVQGAGDYAISFEYTTGDGCTAKSAAKTVKVTEVAKPTLFAKDKNLVDKFLSYLYGKQVYTFTATPDLGYELRWYNTLPVQGKPNTIKETASAYMYTLDPQYASSGALKTEHYLVYLTQYDPISGCESKHDTAKLHVTNCPTPAPIVGLTERACTYATGTEIPTLKAQKNTAWTGEYDDPNVYVYIYTGSEPATAPQAKSEYPIATLDAIEKDYTVQFAQYSTKYECSSGPVTATLKTFKQSAPKRISGRDLVECFGLGTSMSFEVENPTGTTVTWYDGVSNTSTILDTDKKFDFNSSDGDRTAYASLKMIAEPYCESTPGDVKFTFDELDEVPTPTVTDTTEDCALVGAAFNSQQFFLEAITSVGDVYWFDNETATKAQNLNIGTIYPVQGFSLQPGTISKFYAKSYLTTPSGKICESSMSLPAHVNPKITPNKPQIKPSANNNIRNGITFICQGSKERMPVFEVYAVGTINWYDSTVYKDATDLGLIPKALDNGSTLVLSKHIDSTKAGTTVFLAVDSLNDCVSDTTKFKFQIAKKPDTRLDKDTLYFCTDSKGRNIVRVVSPNPDSCEYRWDPSIKDDNLFEDGDDLYSYVWKNKVAGVYEIRVTEINNKNTCSNSDTVRLYAADVITPSFEYEVFTGSQEIAFHNTQTVDTVRGSLWDITKEEKEPYMSRYKWTIVYNADQSVRTLVQVDSTESDRKNNLYYVGRGPSDYDSVIVEVSDGLSTSKKYKAVDYVKSVNGRNVNNRGGIPFKYGISTVTLTRDLYSMSGKPYDANSCRVTSPEVEVFMPIVTGLYIPTSFAPGHPSSLVSVFKPFGTKIVKFNIWVYDNWGNTVFYSNKVDENGQPTEAWDGRDKAGNPMPADVYYWKVDATFEDGTKWEGNPTENGKLKPMGSVFLLR